MRWIARLSLVLGVAATGTAYADNPDADQVVTVPGMPSVSRSTLRVNTATGQGSICFAVNCVPFSEPSPTSPDAYRLVRRETFDGTLASHAWGAVRYDAKSGRTWSLVTDIKTGKLGGKSHPVESADFRPFFLFGFAFDRQRRGRVS